MIIPFVLKNKKTRGILQLLFSLILLAWLVGRVGLDEIKSVLTGINWAWYLPAFLFFLINIAVRTYRWYTLLGALSDRASFGQLLYLYFLGFFFNNFIPSGFGGDVVKVFSLRQEHKQGIEALSSVVMDRVTGMLGSSLIAMVVLFWNGIQAWLGQSGASLSLPPTLMVSVALVSLGALLGFAFVRWSDPLGLLSSLLPFTQRFTANDKVQRLAGTVQQYPLSTLFRALLTSLPFTLGLVVVQYTIARALSVELPVHLFLLFVPLISIINLLPLSFNGLGMREGVYQLLFVPIGVPSASAIGMSLAFYFLRFSTGLIGGLLYTIRSISNIGRASRIDSAELR
jgi:uncharacterized membrane protein YbhN (UPF0104 family)